MRIKPAEGLVVRDPVTMAQLPVDDEGVPVDEYDLYWAARLRDGDVVLVDERAVKTAQIFGAPPKLPATD